MQTIAPSKTPCRTECGFDRGGSGRAPVHIATRWVAPVLAMLLLFASHVRAEASAPLRVQLLWTHQTQFAGYYFAQARTSHLRETTSFELLEGGPGISPLERHSRRGVRLHGAEMSSCRIAWVR